MDEVKTLGFDWEFGHEELALEVSSYADNGCLYIGLHNKTEEGFDHFGKLTVNLPMSSMIPPEPNEASCSFASCSFLLWRYPSTPFGSNSLNLSMSKATFA